MATNTPSTTLAELPDWALPTIQRYLEHHEELRKTLDLSKSAIWLLADQARSGQYAKSVRAKEIAEERSARVRFETLKSLANSEMSNDFPVLNGQASAALWSSLEIFVRTVAASCLEHDRASWKADALQRLKVKIGEFEEMTREEQCAWVIDLLDQDSGSGNRAGVNRFESILAVLGLSGPVRQDAKDGLFELYHVRNVLTHRNGVLDRKALIACPSLGNRPGDRLKVNGDMAARYFTAVSTYVLTIVVRLGDKYGAGDREL